MYGYLRDGYRDVGVFSVSHHRFANLMREMACRGAWPPALRHLTELSQRPSPELHEVIELVAE